MRPANVKPEILKIMTREPNARSGGSGRRLRVLIAEDSQETRKSLSDMCSRLPNLEVVGEAVDGWLRLKLSQL